MQSWWQQAVIMVNAFVIFIIYLITITVYMRNICQAVNIANDGRQPTTGL